LKQRHDRPDAGYGPFAFQLHSETRLFEYPWAFYAADVAPGMRLLDIGGCVGGMQFVFALEGCDVTNVDPCDNDSGGWPATRWPVGPELHERLNGVLGTDVKLVQKRVQDADLPVGGFDRVVCLSVIEHLAQQDARDLVAHAVRLLAPGGLFVATIDLFLDLKPFGVLTRNAYGTNLDVRALIDGLDAELVVGDKRELHGFAEFDRERIVEHVDEFYAPTGYPCLSQAIVLRKHS
jgi:SAM-dependent methyltransferase